jgi:hypothetical protein
VSAAEAVIEYVDHHLVHEVGIQMPAETQLGILEDDFSSPTSGLCNGAGREF